MSVLGFDIGTTACKAVLVDRSGAVIADAESPHDLHVRQAGWAEENPHDWWQGVVTTAGKVLAGRDPRQILALGVSGMVPALLLLDEADEPLRPSIQQNDARATDEIRTCAQQFPEDEYFALTGATWNQQVVPPKLLWIQKHEPEIWHRLRRVTGSYEYITFRLTGARYTEANWALESGMWDPHRQAWIAPILQAAGLAPEALAPVRWPHEIVGEVVRAGETGLPVGTPVVAGSADHIAAALAAGLVTEGEAVFKLGGAGDFLYAVGGFQPLRQLFIDYHDIPNLFVINGCMATSGSLVKWYRDGFRPGVPYADLDREAAAVRPGSDGLVVLPYFLGEKTPLHDPCARGTVVGLTLYHTPAHWYRAILEGVAYAFKHHVEVLENAGHQIGRCYVMDGGARSPLWRRILASVLERQLHHLEGGHAGSAQGVAYVAGVAAGLWGWDQVRDHARIAGVTDPDPSAVPVYAEGYQAYRDIYRRLRDIYPRLERHDAGRT
jgi:xylulokinase